MQPEQQARHMGQIKTQVNHIIDMLDAISYILRAHETKAALNPTILDLEQVCKGVIAKVQAADEAGHEFELTVAGDVAAVALDNDLTQTILTYLLSNAARYSAAGSAVYLDVAREEQTIVARVRDEGIGIPADEQARLFEPFYRASNTGEISGLGLGLAVVKRMVEQHGGSIAIDSDVNQGATFIVRLSLLSVKDDQTSKVRQ
jgi:signal transduction histidine kinase